MRPRLPLLSGSPTRRSRGRGVTLWPVSPSLVRPRPLARALGGIFVAARRKESKAKSKSHPTCPPRRSVAADFGRFPVAYIIFQVTSMARRDNNNGNSGPLGGYTNKPMIDLGTSVRTQSPTPGLTGCLQSNLSPTPKGGTRSLTCGEIQIAQKIYGGSVNYTGVLVHNGLFIAVQPSNTAMTPNGEMYFPPFYFQEDFSTASDSNKCWFMHEMVHVWQHQLGYAVAFRGFFHFNLNYDYTLNEKDKFGDYNMEQQGDILADYFALKFLNNPLVVRNKLNSNPIKTYTIEDYERTLKDFLADPADKKNLP